MEANTVCSGHPKMGEEKLIIRSEKVRFIHVLSMLLLRRPVTSYVFVEAADFGSTPGNWLVALTHLIQKVLATAYYPTLILGHVIEFILNFVALNDGILGIFLNIFRCKLVIPHREAHSFRTIIALVDGRTELKPLPADGGPEDRRLQVVGVSAAATGKFSSDDNYYVDVESGGGSTSAVPLVQQQYVNGRLIRLRTFSVFEVSMMASKIVYENPAYIENVVNNIWKFHFLGFYNCWNKFEGHHTTKAFVCTDKASDASMVVVSFRGTELFNTRDWSTDVDLSWLGLGLLGHVHVGFLKALGLQSEDGKDAAKAFPKDAPDAVAGKPLAYYTLRETLREQLKQHPNANVVVTGHSLGGALAAIFPALLAFHGERDILDRLQSVITYGQPRVGDKVFADYVRANVPVELIRVVYRYDLVPRFPLNAPPVSKFAHGGTCIYFEGWYKGHVIAAGGDAPDPNYFDPRYLLSMYGNAWGDLFKGAFLWTKEGKDYREGALSLLYRATGLLVPGIASHSPRDYHNAVRLGSVVTGKEV